MNKLANERSPYLRHAAHQKVDWHPWSEEAFEKARRENKPLFLSSGAVWCHWCHVMARECFEDDEVANMMNELFVNIKLDRDERPDIDRAYQQSVAAMGGGSGWPLSVFLTPDKKPFFGGTYFPPEDINGRPGFKKILEAVSEFYRTRQEEAGTYAGKVTALLHPDPALPEEISRELLDQAEERMLLLFDPRNGGFGAEPKFPMPAALEFLMRRAARGRTAAGEAARVSLHAMARGGIYDQVSGGFHRYSVDDAWIVPHFEKMAEDNAGLLDNYARAYGIFGDERFKKTASGILGFVSEVLADPAGGFYASQDADVGHDEGGFFTWTDEELRHILDEKEYQAFSLHLLHPRGFLHHDPEKKVLAVVLEPAAIAEKIGESEETVNHAISIAKEKLLNERRKRKSPFIDTTLYASLNGMMIAAYLRAFMIFDEPRLKDFGLKSLERILRERLTTGKLLHAPGVDGMLEDYVHLIGALLSSYEATADTRRLTEAEELMDVARRIFFDQERGGFFDTEKDFLGARMKRIEDVPHPSANGLGIKLLLKLASITGRKEYRQEAEQSLKCFAATAREAGVHAGSYYCSLDSFFNMLTLKVEAHPQSGLARAARFFGASFGSAIFYGPDQNRVIPCSGDACFAPLAHEKEMADFFKNLHSLNR